MTMRAITKSRLIRPPNDMKNPPNSQRITRIMTIAQKRSSFMSDLACFYSRSAIISLSTEEAAKSIGGFFPTTPGKFLSNPSSPGRFFRLHFVFRGCELSHDCVTCHTMTGSFVGSVGRGFEDRIFNIVNEMSSTRATPVAM